MSGLFSIETFRSAGFGPHDMGQWVDRSDDKNPKMLRRETGVRRVAALRAQGEAINAAFRARINAERERCARIVEAFENTDPDRAIAAAAAEIRSGK